LVVLVYRSVIDMALECFNLAFKLVLSIPVLVERPPV